MCGRFTLAALPRAVADHFSLDTLPLLKPRYNVAPTQEIPVVRAQGGRRVCALLRWGLLPPWSKEPPATSPSLINARSETAAEKPSFKGAFRARRCLIPADGFYEWEKRAGGKKKQPWLFRVRGGGPFAFAGLWERREDPGGALESCAILTTGANGLVGRVHDRMPAILSPAEYDRWLTSPPEEAETLRGLLRPFPEGEMEALPVGPPRQQPEE